MPDAVTFHFDPICPFSYQTSRWISRLVDLGEVTATWGLFSLELVNAGRDDVPHGDVHRRSEKALRTCVLVREHEGSDGLGRFYAAIGDRIHRRKEDASDDEVVRAALRDAGLDEALLEKAMGDDGTWEQVRREHQRLCDETRSFGVPTIIPEGGQAIFGPVISRLPSDEDAVELWRHVAWLARYENFSELKRDRTVPLEF